MVLGARRARAAARRQPRGDRLHRRYGPRVRARGANTRQLLLVNLLTDVAPAMAVAVRPPPHRSSTDLLAEGPDTSLSAPLTRDIYLRAGATATAAGTAWALALPLGTPRQASTTGLVGLVGAQLGQTLAVPGRTPLVAAAGVGTALGLVVIIQTPGVSHFFGCSPLLPHHWLLGLGSAAAATTGALVAQQVVGRQQVSAGHAPELRERPDPVRPSHLHEEHLADEPVTAG